MNLFRKEREAVIDATETVSSGINTSLVVASVAIIIAAVALVVAVSRKS